MTRRRGISASRGPETPPAPTLAFARAGAGLPTLVADLAWRAAISRWIARPRWFIRLATAFEAMQMGQPFPAKIRLVLPGIAICIAVTAAAAMLEWVEVRLAGRAWLESLVLAILVGTAVRTCWTPAVRFWPGIAFSAKTLLEVAVVLLGASVSAGAVLSTGPAL